MLAPHELKSKAFSKTLKGYSPAEVDDYIEFLIDKYTELYRENNELERKLKIVVTNFDEIRDEEEAIRSTLLKAQKLGEKIIRDANERADVITGSIKDRCDAIIASFREQTQGRKERDVGDPYPHHRFQEKSVRPLPSAHRRIAEPFGQRDRGHRAARRERDHRPHLHRCARDDSE